MSSEALCIVFIWKISFHSYANKTSFHRKSFALSLAFTMRFRTTWEWPVTGLFSAMGYINKTNNKGLENRNKKNESRFIIDLTVIVTKEFDLLV